VPSQFDKFKEAARELETDDDPERFKEKLAKIARHKPVESPTGHPSGEMMLTAWSKGRV
jgi:hypothetical protein